MDSTTSFKISTSSRSPKQEGLSGETSTVFPLYAPSRGRPPLLTFILLIYLFFMTKGGLSLVSLETNVISFCAMDASYPGQSHTCLKRFMEINHEPQWATYEAGCVISYGYNFSCQYPWFCCHIMFGNNLSLSKKLCKRSSLLHSSKYTVTG